MEHRDWLDGVLRDTTADPYAVAELIEECEEQLSRLPESGIPSGAVPKNGLSVSQLLGFLSDRWLDDHQVNAGCKWVMHVAIQSGVERVQVADASLLQSLAISRQPSDRPEPPRRTKMDTAIQANEVDYLYIPVFVHGNHWTLFRVDFISHTFSYADCYSPDGPLPYDQLDLILGWLGSLDPRFSTRPSHVPFRPGFRLPKQKDTTSCGIIVMSLLATLVLDHPVWKQDHARLERVRWFTRLTPPVDTEVSYTSFWLCCQTYNTCQDESQHPAESSGSEADQEDLVAPDDDKPASPPSTSSFPSPRSTTSLLPSPQSSTLKTRPTLGKRSSKSTAAPATNPSDSEYELSDSAEAERTKRRKRGPQAELGPKPGSSWDKQKKLKARAQDPDFEANQQKLGDFRSKIRAIDPYSEFFDDDHLKVRCSACGGTPTMRALYDTRRFKDHRQSKRCQIRQSKSAPSQTLLSLGFKRKTDRKDCSVRCMMEMHCPGLTGASDPRVATYLSRTTAATGGAPSRRKIALILFAIGDWCELSVKEKRAVLRREEVLARWRNSRAVDAVFSTGCTNTVYGAVGQDPPACEECKSLYELKTFMAALRRPIPREENMKFVPKAHRCPELGDIYIKYHGLRGLMEQVRSNVIDSTNACN